MTHPALYKKLVKVFKEVNTKNSEVNHVLEALLTPSERNDIALRFEILKRLHRGDSQRDIASSLGVGVATVSRGSQQLQKLGGTLDHLLK